MKESFVKLLFRGKLLNINSFWLDFQYKVVPSVSLRAISDGSFRKPRLPASESPDHYKQLLAVHIYQLSTGTSTGRDALL